MNRFALWKALIFAPLIPFLLAASCNLDKITGIDATASPSSISSGGTSSLNATITGAGTFNLNVNWSIVSGGGSLSSNTGSNVTYTAPTVTVQTSVQVKASAVGDANFSKTLTLSVSPLTATDKPVISSFTATPSSLPSGGGSVLLAWNVAGATSLSIDQSVGEVSGLTSKSVAVTVATTFTLTATNTNGSSTKTFVVTVGTAGLPAGVWDTSNWDAATWQ
jgi:hypothetical protein